jgi:hypothetical protein
LKGVPPLANGVKRARECSLSKIDATEIEVVSDFISSDWISTFAFPTNMKVAPIAGYGSFDTMPIWIGSSLQAPGQRRTKY